MAEVQQDKRKLEALYRQLYSSSASKNSQVDKTRESSSVKVTREDLPKIQPKTVSLDYVRKDLTKILILSMVAILAQLLLYFASIRNLVTLNLF